MAASAFPLSRRERPDEVRLAGSISGVAEADEAQRAALVPLLGLLALDALRFDYTLTAETQGRIAVRGRLQARFAQACGVTLEPLATIVDEPIAAAYWPADQVAAEVASPDDALADAPEPIIGDTVDLGALAVEELSVRIDPFPRAPGAELEFVPPDADKLRPFSALAKLKPPADR